MALTFREMCEYMGLTSAQFTNIPKEILAGPVRRCVIDSRQVQKDDIFFAFRGERVNGESYVASSLKAGAAAVVVSKDYCEIDDPRIIAVEDVQWALQELARGYRSHLELPIVAISGSVGKTSTKDLMAHVLSNQLKVFKTRGNYNNELGLPLMLMELDNNWDVAILEMGMNHPGELARLVEIARPQIAVLTNIGTAHIEFFGTREGIFKAKMEIASKLEAEDVLILNGQDDLLCTVLEKAHSQKFPYQIEGIGRIGDIFWAEEIKLTAKGTHFNLVSANCSRPVFLPLWGKHHVINSILALTVVEKLNLDLDGAIQALATVPATPMRFEKIMIADRMWINDAYNASRDSMIPAVETIVAIADSAPWIIFGDVFECGDQSDAIHTQIGLELNQFNLGGAVFVGSAMKMAYKAYMGKKYYFATVEAGLEDLQDILKDAPHILVKASRGMALERIINYFQEL